MPSTPIPVWLTGVNDEGAIRAQALVAMGLISGGARASEARDGPRRRIEPRRGVRHLPGPQHLGRLRTVAMAL